MIESLTDSVFKCADGYYWMKFSEAGTVIGQKAGPVLLIFTCGAIWRFNGKSPEGLLCPVRKDLGELLEFGPRIEEPQ